MLIKWFPRSWIQIKTNQFVIYIDPSFISTYYKNNSNIIRYSDAEDDFLPENLEKANLILISHIHKDHCKEVNINRLSTDNTIILTPKKYQKDNNKNIKIIKPNTECMIENLKIEIVNAYNIKEGHSTRKVHKKGDCVGYILQIEDKKLYFSGDTDLIPEMKELTNIEVAFLPIGGVFTMDLDEAVEATMLIKPQIAIPVHHLKVNPMDYKRLLENNIQVKVLNIGEEIMI